MTTQRDGTDPEAAGRVAQFTAAARRVRIPSRSDVRTAVRWGVRQGVPGVALKLGARTGDMFARLNTDPALKADPYGYYDLVRTAAPVVPGRYVMATSRHSVAMQILRGDEFRSGIPEELMPRPMQAVLEWSRDDAAVGGLTDRPSMLMNNGADHLRLRRIASKAFTPKAIEALRTRVGQIATELLDEVERRQHGGATVDIVTEYAGTLPVLAIAEILGVPPELQSTFLDWGERILPAADWGVPLRTYRDISATLREMNDWLLQHFDALRRDPGDNLLSRIVSASDAEKAIDPAGGLSEAELVSVAGLLLFAGFETTVTLIGAGTVRLLGDRDQLELLGAQPERWRNAIEEILRIDAPVQFTVRYPARDTEVAGVPIPRGRMVAVLLAGASRDPEVFPEPTRFDITRENARDHLGFGSGAHFCIGAPLARLEGEIGLRKLFDRFPDMTLAGRPILGPNTTFRGYAHIPTRLNA
ncbi:MAG: putative cytochrome [Nocardia sp.]|uniref:cytochrome P450 n=1 Tax=Nocardia sp. TaxID=1821 RepID=UPI00261E0106|nr:cytochrome P450 [Nocardia sp.]MCU1641314.1 putative cytochrome [Nocardia sp.]